LEQVAAVVVAVQVALFQQTHLTGQVVAVAGLAVEQAQ
jgi:hypothetical protein